MIDRERIRAYAITKEVVENYNYSRKWLDGQLCSITSALQEVSKYFIGKKEEIKDLHLHYSKSKADVVRLSQFPKSKELQDSIRLMLYYNNKANEAANICEAYELEFKELKELESTVRTLILELKLKNRRKYL